MSKCIQEWPNFEVFIIRNTKMQTAHKIRLLIQWINDIKTLKSNEQCTGGWNIVCVVQDGKEGRDCLNLGERCEGEMTDV